MKGDKTFFWSLARLTIVIALQNLVSFGVNLADSLMLGNYSETALSGATLSNQTQFLLQMVIGGVGEGIVVLSSQYWGKKLTAPMRAITAAGLKIAIIIGVALSAFVVIFPTQTLSLFTNKQNVIEEGVKYIQVVGFSYAFFAVTYTLTAAMRAAEVARLGLLVSVVALLVNIPGNYIFIYGKLGFPEMGSAGAALSTLISRFIEFAIVVFYVFFYDDRIKFRLKHLFEKNKQLFGDYVRAGVPVILSGALWAFGSWAQTSILGRLDAEEVITASSISSTAFQIASVAVYGVASASGVLIGKAVGAGDIGKIKQYTKTLQILFLIFGVLTSVVVFVGRGAFLSMYSISDMSKNLTNQFMAVLSVTVIGTAYQMSCLTGIVRGGGDTKFVLYNDMIFVWLIVVPAAALSAFVFHAPPIVTFICIKSDQILKCFVAVVHVNRYKWIKNLTR